jgi:hypothetical protein
VATSSQLRKIKHFGIFSQKTGQECGSIQASQLFIIFMARFHSGKGALYHPLDGITNHKYMLLCFLTPNKKNLKEKGTSF